MGPIGEAFVRIRADTRGMKGEVEKGTKTALLGAAKTAAGLVGVFGGVKFFEEAIKDAAEEEKALTSLKRSIKAAGQSWEIHGRSLKEVLTDMEEATGTGLPELSQGLLRLVTATGSVEKGYKDLRIAQDVAIARHMGLAQAAVILAKAEGGNDTALRRLGIILPKITTHVDALKGAHDRAVLAGATFTKGQQAQYKQSLANAAATDKEASRQNILSELQRRFGGQTKAFAQTAAGEYARLRETVKNIMEDIGGALLPGLAEGASGVRDFVHELRTSESFSEGLHGSIHALGEVLHDIGVAATLVGPPLKIAARGAEELSKAFGVGGILTVVAAYKAYGVALTAAEAIQAKYTATLAVARGAQVSETSATQTDTGANRVHATSMEIEAEALLASTAAIEANTAALFAHTTASERDSIASRLRLGTSITPIGVGVASTAARDIGEVGGAAALTTTRLGALRSASGNIGRSLVRLVPPEVLGALGVAGLAFGVYKVITRESDWERANATLRASIESLGVSVTTLRANEERLSELRLEIPTLRAAKAAASLAVERDRLALANTKAAKGSLAYRTLQNQLAADEASLSTTTHQLKITLQQTEAAENNTATARRRHTKAIEDEIRIAQSLAHTQQETVARAVEIAKAEFIGIGGAIDKAGASQLAQKARTEESAAALARYVTGLEESAQAEKKKYPTLARNVEMLARYVKVIGRLPTRREVELVLKVKGLKDLQDLRAELQPFEQGAKGDLGKGFALDVSRANATIAKNVAADLKKNTHTTTAAVDTAATNVSVHVANYGKKVSDAVADAAQAVTDAQTGLADTIKQGEESVTDSVNSAKTNLNSIGSSLADAIGRFLDTGKTKKKKAGAGSLPAALKAEFEEVKRELAAGIDTPELRQRAKALASMLQAAAGKAAPKTKDNSDAIDKKKTRVARDLADLTDLYNKHAISRAKFETRLTAILKREHITRANIQKKLGVAAADEFTGLLTGLHNQAGAERGKGVPQRSGTGLIPAIVKPLDALRASQKANDAAQRTLDEARNRLAEEQLDAQKDIAASAKKTAERLAKIHSAQKGTAFTATLVAGKGGDYTFAVKPQKKTMGGTVTGAGGVDQVPALLTRGEIVMNTSQQHGMRRALGMGPGTPDQLFSTITRFQRGGVAQVPLGRVRGLPIDHAGPRDYRWLQFGRPQIPMRPDISGWADGHRGRGVSLAQSLMGADWWREHWPSVRRFAHGGVTTGGTLRPGQVPVGGIPLGRVDIPHITSDLYHDAPHVYRWHNRNPGHNDVVPMRRILEKWFTDRTGGGASWAGALGAADWWKKRWPAQRKFAGGGVAGFHHERGQSGLKRQFTAAERAGLRLLREYEAHPQAAEKRLGPKFPWHNLGRLLTLTTGIDPGVVRERLHGHFGTLGAGGRPIRPGERLAGIATGGPIGREAQELERWAAGAAKLRGDAGAISAGAAHLGVPLDNQILRQELALQRSGRSKFLPRGARGGDATLGSLRHLTADLDRRLREGLDYTQWYKYGGREILSYAGGNKQLASKIAALAAIYSPQRAVVPNIGLALKAMDDYRLGQPLSVGTKYQKHRAQLALAGKDWRTGYGPNQALKTRAFYGNLMKHVEGQKAHRGRGYFGDEVTIDGWIGAAFGWSKRTKDSNLTPARYRFAERTIRELAARHHLEPEEAQAAIWVSIKAERDRATRAAYKNPATRGHAISRSGVGFAEALQHGPHNLRLTAEALSAQKLWQRRLSAGQKRRYTGEVGRDVLDTLHQHGIPSRLTSRRRGLYRNDAGQLEFNPQFALELALGGIPGSGRLHLTRQQNAYYGGISGAIADVLKQEGVGFMRPFRGISKSENTAFRVNLGRSLSTKELHRLGGALNHQDFYYTPTDKGFIVARTDPGAQLALKGPARTHAYQAAYRHIGQAVDSTLGKGAWNDLAGQAKIQGFPFAGGLSGAGALSRSALRASGRPALLHGIRDDLALRVAATDARWRRATGFAAGGVAGHGRFAAGGVATAFKDLPAAEKRRRILAGLSSGRLTLAKAKAAFRFWHLGQPPTIDLGPRAEQAKRRHGVTMGSFETQGQWLRDRLVRGGASRSRATNLAEQIYGGDGGWRGLLSRLIGGPQFHGTIGRATREQLSQFDPRTRAGAIGIAGLFVGGKFNPREFADLGGTYNPNAAKGVVQRVNDSTGFPYRAGEGYERILLGALREGQRFTMHQHGKDPGLFEVIGRGHDEGAMYPWSKVKALNETARAFMNGAEPEKWSARSTVSPIPRIPASRLPNAETQKLFKKLGVSPEQAAKLGPQGLRALVHQIERGEANVPAASRLYAHAVGGRLAPAPKGGRASELGHEVESYLDFFATARPGSPRAARPDTLKEAETIYYARRAAELANFGHGAQSAIDYDAMHAAAKAIYITHPQVAKWIKPHDLFQTQGDWLNHQQHGVEPGRAAPVSVHEMLAFMTGRLMTLGEKNRPGPFEHYEAGVRQAAAQAARMKAIRPELEKAFPGLMTTEEIGATTGRGVSPRMRGRPGKYVRGTQHEAMGHDQPYGWFTRDWEHYLSAHGKKLKQYESWWSIDRLIPKRFSTLRRLLDGVFFDGPGAPKKFAAGGIVPGPAGAGDVVPSMLSPGELVISNPQRGRLESGSQIAVRQRSRQLEETKRQTSLLHQIERNQRAGDPQVARLHRTLQHQLGDRPDRPGHGNAARLTAALGRTVD